MSEFTKNQEVFVICHNDEIKEGRYLEPAYTIPGEGWYLYVHLYGKLDKVSCLEGDVFSSREHAEQAVIDNLRRKLENEKAAKRLAEERIKIIEGRLEELQPRESPARVIVPLQVCRIPFNCDNLREYIGHFECIALYCSKWSAMPTTAEVQNNVWRKKK